ncbi:hypothetical protein [Methylocella sp.]|jgi:hypothetical protein|uniref:hypothetical protein n=1 Tax=Methylocella sp. TaxID=1978226 RepID=UPI003C1B9148
MSLKRSPANERTKRRYLHFLREAKGRDETSIDQVAKAIERFDEYNRRRDFAKFHIEQARGFKAHLMEQRKHTNGRVIVGGDYRFDPRHVEGFHRLALRGTRLPHAHQRLAALRVDFI